MDKFRSEEERMAAIEETQRLMRSFDHVYTEQLVDDAIGKFWEIRELVIKFQCALLLKAHAKETWRSRRKLFNNCRNGGEKIFREHVVGCDQCFPLFKEGARQMNDFLTKRRGSDE